MNMFKKVKAESVEVYIAAVPEERRSAIEFLHNFIQSTSPTLKPHFAYNMLGYGSFKYKNYKKEIIDWPTVALANQKNYISVYICSVKDGQYIAEKYKADLGKVSVGKSCIRFKKLEDVNLKILGKIIKEASDNPGFMAENKTN